MVHKNKRIIKHTKNERKKLSPNHMVKIYFTSYLRLKFRLRGPPLKRRRWHIHHLILGALALALDK
jgi:hypothetical protein